MITIKLKNSNELLCTDINSVTFRYTDNGVDVYQGTSYRGQVEDTIGITPEELAEHLNKLN